MEQHFLFYRTNDLMSARMKADYFNAFLDELLPVLEHDGLIDAHWKQRFETLREAYALGFDAYERLRIEMQEYSGDDTKSLLELSEQYVDEKGQGLKGQAHEEALADEAMDTMRDIILKHYDIGLADDQAPTPLLLLLARKVRTLAALTLKEQEPHTDFDDPKCDWFDKFDAVYTPLMQQSLDGLAESDALEDVVVLSRDLDAKIAEKDGIPADFRQRIEQAARKAGKTVLGRAKDYVLANRDRHRLYRTRSGTILDEVISGHDTPQALLLDIRSFLAEAAGLPYAHSKSLIVDYLDNFAAVTIDEGFFGWTHPATLVAAQDFVAEFRRNLASSMLASGHEPDTAFLKRIMEVEKGLEYAYQSRNTAGDWLMEESHGGTDCLFHAQWLRLGWDPKKIAKSEIPGLAENARGHLSVLSEQRKIPEHVRNHPLIPLIYERCAEIARAEYEHEVHKDQKTEGATADQTSWVDRVAGRPLSPSEVVAARHEIGADRLRVETAQAQQEEEAVSKERAERLFTSLPQEFQTAIGSTAMRTARY
jgi:hypothetical protein